MKNLLIIFSLCLISFACKKHFESSSVSSVSIKEARETGTYDYRATKTGNYSDTSVWDKKVSGVWVDAHNVPDTKNSIFIEAAVELDLDSNFNCKDLNLNTTADLKRLNTGSDSLFIYGKIRTYSGSAPGTDDDVNSGIFGWIDGTLVFKGGTVQIVSNHQFSANNNNSGFDVVIDKGSDTARIAYQMRVGNMTVKTGTLIINPTSATLRPSGDSALVQGGFVLVKSGATLVAGNIYRTQTAPFTDFTLEAGAKLYFNSTATPILSAQNVYMNGTVYISGTTGQFPGGLGRVGSADINTFNNLTVKDSGAKKLINNVSVTGTYSLVLPATINYNGFTLTNP